jgi:hypothetical protein
MFAQRGFCGRCSTYGGSAEAGRAVAEAARCAFPAGGSPGYTEPVPLFWLTYHYPDCPGVVVIESTGLLHARLKASLARADRGLAFVSGQQLDPVSAAQVPAN